MKILEPDILEKACLKVIDALNEFEPEYKIASLKMLIDNFPADYTMVKQKKKCTCEIPTLRNGIKGYCVSCGGDL